MDPITEAEKKVPPPHKASRLWSGLYDLVVNADDEVKAKKGLATVKCDYGLSPDLDAKIASGDYGIRLKGIRLMALERTGAKLS
jgi:hypothetical protein